MKLDTEEAFFRAVYGANKGVAPAQIALAVFGADTSAHAEKRQTLRIMFVHLMEAAFLVHQRCIAQPIPDHDFLAHAIQRACETLPEGFSIAIHIERDSSIASLYDPVAVPVPFSDDADTLAAHVDNAVKAALALSQPSDAAA